MVVLASEIAPSRYRHLSTFNANVDLVASLLMHPTNVAYGSFDFVQRNHPVSTRRGRPLPARLQQSTGAAIELDHSPLSSSQDAPQHAAAPHRGCRQHA